MGGRSVVGSLMTSGAGADPEPLPDPGPVRGFAWTLSIGVFTSVFAALFITRLLVVWWFRSTRNKRLPI